jgi:hypothetical protein
MQLRQTILTVLAVALAKSAVTAQPVAITLWTIEARVAQADHVGIGTIGKVSRNVIVAPGGPDKIGVIYPDGRFEYAVTLKISEVLKGNLKGTVDDLCAIQSVGANNRLEEWSKAQTPILCFLGPTPKKGEQRDWDIQPLAKQRPSVALAPEALRRFCQKTLPFSKTTRKSWPAHGRMPKRRGGRSQSTRSRSP